MAAEVVGPEGADDAPARHSLRAFVREAVGTPTGPGLAAALEALMGRDDLSAREWVEVTSAWKKMECYCVAARMTAVAEVDRAKIGASEGRTAPGRDDPVRPAADELAPVLGIALRTASSLVGLTRRMDDFPAAMDALAEGRMDYAQVRVLDRVVRDLAPGAAAAVESAAVAWASGCTPQQLHADLATEAMRVDPEHAATAAARGVDERDVTWRISRTPGCGRLVSDLPSISGAAGWMALNTAAKNARKVGVRADGRPEDRTVAQLRADILSSLLTGQGDPLGGHVPTPAELARLAEVQVVVAADTLTGAGDLPAHVPGMGPVDVATARRVSQLAPARRLVADPLTGALLHADQQTRPPIPDPRETPRSSATLLLTGQPPTGQPIPGDPRWQWLLGDVVEPAYPDDGSRYRPSVRLRRHVNTRDATCIGPACFHPALGTQLDHTINHGEQDASGAVGATTDGDLGSVCERMHNAKTHGGWRLEQPSPGTFIWTSPTGRTYLRVVRALVPGWALRGRRAGAGPSSPERRRGPRPRRGRRSRTGMTDAGPDPP